MFAGHWVLRGYGLWAVEERVTGEFLGRVGCLNLEGFPAFEIAYTLAPWAWGKGYAREGAAAALRYARETLGRRCRSSPLHPKFVGISQARPLGSLRRIRPRQGALPHEACRVDDLAVLNPGSPSTSPDQPGV
jgi:hypothetical protein